MEPTSSDSQHVPIDIADDPVADAGDEGERHGVGDVGGDDAHDRQAGIEQHQHGDAEGAGADRGDGDQNAERRAEGDGDGKAQFWRQFAMIAGKAEQAAAEDQRQRGEQQHGAQEQRHGVRKAGIGAAGLRDEIERDGGGGDAAEREGADDGPVDVAVEARARRCRRTW